MVIGKSAKFKIYNSSAGSGKTYTLVKEYLLLSLADPHEFKRILAITFTNKAAKEMKDRILGQLKSHINGKEEPLSQELTQLLKISKEQLAAKSQQLLDNILNNYSEFSVSTIDSFFQNILFAFINEEGINLDLKVEMDLAYVIDQITDKVINQATNDELTTWLTQLALNRIMEGQSFNFRGQVSTMVSEIISNPSMACRIHNNPPLEETADPTIEGVVSRDIFKQYVIKLDQKISLFEEKIVHISTAILKTISDNNITPQELAYGERGIYGYLRKLSDRNITEFSTRGISILEGKAAWYSRTSDQKANIENIADKILTPALEQLHKIFIEGYEEYVTSREIKSHIYILGIVNEIISEIDNFRLENQAILISDIAYMISKIADNIHYQSIYEKVSEQYHHILIDEFQDLSTIQWNNIYPLAENITASGGNLIILGDPKQSIYRWRGSDSSIMTSKVTQQFTKEIIENNFLDTNYRSSKEIIGFNNEFFRNTVEKIHQIFEEEISNLKISPHCSQEDKTYLLSKLEDLTSTYINIEQKHPSTNQQLLNTSPILIKSLSTLSEYNQEEPRNITLIPYDESRSESIKNIYEVITADKASDVETSSIMEVIAQLEKYQQEGIAPKDILILTRTNLHSKQIADQTYIYSNSPLAKQNINYDLKIDSIYTLGNSPLVCLIINVIKYYLMPDNEVLLLEIIHTYNTHILGKANIYESFSRERQLDYLPKEFEKLEKEIFSHDIRATIDLIIEIFDIENNISDSEQGIFYNFVEESISEYGDSHIALIENWDKKGYKIYLESKDNEGVRLMTIHQSKGLQAKAVILYINDWKIDHSGNNSPLLWCNTNCEDEPPIVPIRYSKKIINTRYLKEYYKEKLNIYYDNLNLLYVALTRPEEYITIIYNSNNTSKITSKSKKAPETLGQISDLFRELKKRVDVDLL